MDAVRRFSYRGLRTLSGLQYRLHRRLTPAGRVVMGALFVGALFGIDTRQSLAFQLFSLAFALLAAAWLLSLSFRGRFTARRRLPRYATVGEACRYRVELTSERRRGEGVWLMEAAADPRPTLARFLSTPAPGEGGINPFDRLFGYPRWSWLIEREGRMEPPEARPLPPLEPGRPVTVELELTPRRRGWLTLPALRVGRDDPLGLARGSVDAGVSERLLVLPKRYPAALRPAAGNRRLQPGGVALASTVGDSQEFIGLRDYRPGDSPRRLHWPAWARSGRPVVKEFQEEYFSRQALLLDSFAAPDGGGGAEAAFEAAVSVAASLVEPLGRGDALLDLMFVADRAYRFTAGRGLASNQHLLEVLAAVESSDAGAFEALADTVRGHAAQLSAVVCVLLAWDEPRRALVEGLRAGGVPVTALVVGEEVIEASPGLLHIHPERIAEGLARL